MTATWNVNKNNDRKKMFFILFSSIPILYFYTLFNIHSSISNGNDNTLGNEKKITSIRSSGKGDGDAFPSIITTTTTKARAVETEKERNENIDPSLFVSLSSEFFDLSLSETNINNNYNTHLWENDNNPLPNWMKEYFLWHQVQRKELDSIRWNVTLKDDKTTEYKFLIMQCLKGSKKCGGTADRLMPIPYLILLAAQSKRILLIDWGRPSRLEEFLLPPMGGLDWRIPPIFTTTAANTSKKNEERQLPKYLREGPRGTSHISLIDLLFSDTTSPINTIKSRFQSHDHGELYYNQQQELIYKKQQLQWKQLQPKLKLQNPKIVSLPTFYEVYSNCWYIVFTPTPIISNRIQQQMNQLQLLPKEYIGVHVRALYGRLELTTNDSNNIITTWTKNSINCGTQLLSTILLPANSTNTNICLDNNNNNSMKIFFASDSSLAAKIALQHGKEQEIKQKHDSSSNSILIEVVSNNNTTDPLHLDKAKNKKIQPQDYYNTFIDLYILAMSRCVTYHIGGYGKWASYIGNIDTTNSDKCFIQQHADGNGNLLHKCDWKNYDYTDFNTLDKNHCKQQQLQLQSEQLIKKQKQHRPFYASPVQD